MRDVLMVIALVDFRDEEYLEPRDVFLDVDFNVKVASLELGKAVGTDGAEVNIDMVIEDVMVEEFDAVVFIGGPGMNTLVEEGKFINLANDFYVRQKVCAAICVAPSILAYAGVLDGKIATCWEGSRGALDNGGATYTGESVVADGLVVTANGPDAAHEFGQKIVEVLSEI